MMIRSPRFFTCLLFFGILFRLTSIKADTTDNLIAKYRRAIVKLTVTGNAPDGRPKPPASGSGFVIYSGAHNSLILTAAHVVGSSDWRQALNPDWQVEPDGRTLNRLVKVEILDQHGALSELGQGGSVIVQDDQKDVAVLLIDRTGLPVVPFAEKASAVRLSFWASIRSAAQVREYHKCCFR